MSADKPQTKFYMFVWPTKIHVDSLFCSAACEKDVQNVCANSSEEHLQPFKDKMDSFLTTGK